MIPQFRVTLSLFNAVTTFFNGRDGLTDIFCADGCGYLLLFGLLGMFYENVVIFSLKLFLHIAHTKH